MTRGCLGITEDLDTYVALPPMGSCTCALTKSNVPQMEKLYKDFRDKATFAFIYTKDAHPAPKKSVKVDGEEVQLTQPKTLRHRIDLAKHLLHNTGLTLPVYIDDMSRVNDDTFVAEHLNEWLAWEVTKR